MQNKLPLPIGASDYKKVSQNYYYVDKTLLIKDILDEQAKVTLFTRPRRFGKTLNMDMLRTFFEKAKDDTSKFFINKNIWQKGEKYTQHQGQYPVIFLSFKDANKNKWPDLYARLKETIKDEFMRHSELKNSKNLSNPAFYEKITSGLGTETDYATSLLRLSQMLHEHYGKAPIIIIDEYDTPIQAGYIHGFYDATIQFTRDLLSSVLKDNQHISFGFLTGILRVAKESIFSGLNNVNVNSLLDKRYSDFFGFTDAEVNTMAAYYQATDKIPEIKEWYDGYLFGNTEIYNPWSVINYFNNNCKPKAFWSRTSGNEIIGELIRSSDKEVYESLSLLLQGKEVQSIINTDIIYPEVNADSDTIYSFLLVAGYLRATSVISEFNDNPICSLKLPNREIKSVFQKEILDNYNTLFNGSLLRDFELALRTGDTALFTDTLQKYLLQSASTFDTTNENFYHGTVFGMLAILSDRYYISSNRESGEGRFDIQLEPKDKSQLGYIIEFKAGKNLSDTELADSASSAIQQIQSKKYSTDMEYHGIKKIGLFGIAFSGKRVAAKYEEIQLHS